MTDRRFTATTTVDDVVRADAALNRVFGQHGIDTCCGGQRTLAQAAAEAGIDVSDLLRSLGAEVAPAAPSTAAPLADERPRRAAAGAGAAIDARTAAARSALFFVGSLFFALTFGALLGAEILARLALQGDAPLPPWVDAAKTAHAYSQVFGFAGLFVMGVALHAVPRFKNGELARPQLMPVALWLQIVGVLVVAVGALVGGFVAAAARVIGAAALLGAALAFAGMMRQTLRAGGAASEGFEGYLRGGCTWLVIASALALGGALRGSSAIQPAVWEAALWGFLGLWVMGMSLRIMPVILGAPASGGRAATLVLVGYQASLGLWVLAVAGDAWTSFPVLRVVGGLGLAVCGAWFVWQLGVLRPGVSAGVGFEEGYGKFIVSAYAWFLVALVFVPAWRALAEWGGYGAPALVLDFGRHAFALGFMTQMVFGVAMRVVPVFTGARLWSGRWRDASFYLLNAAVLTRAMQVSAEVPGLQVVATYVWVSGVLGVAAFVAFAVNVVMTMRSRPRALSAEQPPVYQHDPVATGLMGRRKP